MPTSLRRIDRQLAKLSEATQRMFAHARSLPPGKYHQQPSPGAWSVAEIMNHVYLSEFLSLLYLRKKLSYPDQVPPYHPKSWLGIVLIKFVFALRIKVKAPPTIDMNAKRELMEIDALEKKWTALRADIRSFIATHHEQFGSHLAFRHLFAGRMTMYQMLIFFNAHLRNHYRQQIRHAASLGQ